jgi:hypothetical protein
VKGVVGKEPHLSLPSSLGMRIPFKTTCSTISFHPLHPNLLLITSAKGNISLINLTDSIEPTYVTEIDANVSRLVWSEDGTHFGILSDSSPSFIAATTIMC